LHGCDGICCWADLVGADGAHGVDCPGVFGKFKDFLSGFGDLESAVVLDCELAMYRAPRQDLFRLVSMTFLPLQKKVSPRWRQACKSVLEIA
jgi:hypothetical protein